MVKKGSLSLLKHTNKLGPLKDPIALFIFSVGVEKYFHEHRPKDFPRISTRGHVNVCRARATPFTPDGSVGGALGVPKSLFLNDGHDATDYDEAARTPADILLDEYGATDAPTHGELSAGDVAIDLVTRQALVVRDCVADDLATYYDEHDFDLLNYKQHRWLPVGIDDPVYECVFVGDVEGLHKFSNTYDYPASRLARVPVELAGGED